MGDTGSATLHHPKYFKPYNASNNKETANQNSNNIPATNQNAANSRVTNQNVGDKRAVWLLRTPEEEIMADIGLHTMATTTAGSSKFRTIPLHLETGGATKEHLPRSDQIKRTKTMYRFHTGITTRPTIVNNGLPAQSSISAKFYISSIPSAAKYAESITAATVTKTSPPKTPAAISAAQSQKSSTGIPEDRKLDKPPTTTMTVAAKSEEIPKSLWATGTSDTSVLMAGQTAATGRAGDDNRIITATTGRNLLTQRSREGHRFEETLIIKHGGNRALDGGEGATTFAADYRLRTGVKEGGAGRMGERWERDDDGGDERGEEGWKPSPVQSPPLSPFFLNARLSNTADNENASKEASNQYLVTEKSRNAKQRRRRAQSKSVAMHSEDENVEDVHLCSKRQSYPKAKQSQGQTTKPAVSSSVVNSNNQKQNSQHAERSEGLTDQNGTLNKGDQSRTKSNNQNKEQLQPGQNSVAKIDEDENEATTMAPVNSSEADDTDSKKGHSAFYLTEEHFRGIILTILGVALLDFNCDACQSPCRWGFIIRLIG
jgi:hypothetical protein